MTAAPTNKTYRFAPSGPAGDRRARTTRRRRPRDRSAAVPRQGRTATNPGPPPIGPLTGEQRRRPPTLLRPPRREPTRGDDWRPLGHQCFGRRLSGRCRTRMPACPTAYYPLARRVHIYGSSRLGGREDSKLWSMFPERQSTVEERHIGSRAGDGWQADQVGIVLALCARPFAFLALRVNGSALSCVYQV